MNKKILTILLSLSLLVLSSCQGTTVDIEENKIIKAFLLTAHSVSGAKSEGDSNFSRMRTRFNQYNTIIEQLSGGADPIITKDQADIYKETAKNNIQWFEDVWKNSQTLDKYINTMTSNCAWILSPTYLLDIYNYCLICSAIGQKEIDKVENSGNKNTITFYSCASAVWEHPEIWDKSEELKTGMFADYNGDPVVSQVVGELITGGTTITKLSETAETLGSLLSYKFNDTNNPSLKEYIDAQLNKNDDGSLRTGNDTVDFFYKLDATEKNCCWDKFSGAVKDENGCSLFKLKSKSETRDEKSEYGTDFDGVMTTLYDKDWRSDLIENCMSMCKARRFGYVSITTDFKEIEIPDAQGGEPNTVYKYTANIDNKIIDSAVLSQNINRYIDDTKFGYVWDQELRSQLGANPRLLTEDNVDNVVSGHMVSGGIATVHNSLTDRGSINEEINTEIFEFVYTSDVSITEFTALLERYDKTNDSTSKGKLGDMIFGYLGSTDEILEDGELTTHFRGSKPDAYALEKYTKVENILLNIANGKALEVSNSVGNDFVYMFFNIPLYALKMYELKPNAKRDQETAKQNKISDGYLSLKMNENHQGIPILFRTWNIVDTIDNVTSEGFNSNSNTGIIFDFIEKKFYFKGNDNSDPKYTDPDVDKLTTEERTSIFKAEPAANVDVPYSEMTHTFLPSMPGHVLLAEYRALYKHNVGGDDWYPIGRKIYLNQRNIDFTESDQGVYRWLDSGGKPVAFFSDPQSNLYPNGKAYGINIEHLADSDMQVTSGMTPGPADDSSDPFTNNETIYEIR